MHSKVNNKQDEKTTSRMGENTCKKKKATDKGLISKRKVFLNFKNVKHQLKILGSLRHFGDNSNMIYNVWFLNEPELFFMIIFASWKELNIFFLLFKCYELIC